MKMKKFLLPLCVCFSVCLFAQDSSSSESNASPLITSQAPNSSENAQPIGSRQEKSPKKEKNKKSQEGDDLNASIRPTLKKLGYELKVDQVSSG